MAKKVKYSDLFEDKDLFGPVVESGKSAVKVLDDIEKRLKELLKTSSELGKSVDFSKLNVQEIEKAEKAITDTKKATEALNDVDKVREQLLQRLKQAQEENGSEIVQLRERIKEQRKENRLLAREQAGLNDEYKQLSNRLVEARRQWKNLAAQNKENTEEAKELLKEVQDLDKKIKDIDKTVGQHQRNVGNYTSALEGLEKQFDRLIGPIEDVDREIGQLQNTMRRIQGLAIVGILTNLVQLFAKNEDAADGFQKVMNQVTVRVTAFVNAIVNVTQREGTNMVNFFGRLGEEIVKTTKELDEVVEKFNKLVDAERDTRKGIAEMTKSLADARKRAEEFRMASDDNTRSLDDQLEALLLFEEEQEKVNKKEIALARARLKLINDRVAAERAANSEGKATTASLEEQAEAYAALREAEIQAASESFEIARRKAEIAQDQAELELDILIDAQDTQKTINERIIADEGQAFQKRRALLQKTRQEVDGSFQAQIAVIEEFAKVKLDSNMLINESDSQVLKEEMRRLGVSERLQTRVLEIVRERRLAIQDLDEAQRALAESERNRNRLSADIALQEDLLRKLMEKRTGAEKAFKEAQDARLQNEIDFLRGQVEVLEGNELLEAQQSLNEKLIEQQKQRIDKQKALEEDFQQATFQLISNFAQKRAEAQLAAIDKQIDASQQREQELRAAAEKGSQDAVDNLAFEQKRRAELEKEREEQVRRQARIELALSAFQAYSSKVASGEPNAFGSTVAEITALQQFVNSLPTFWEGTERVADSLGEPHMAGRDGYIVRVDGSERIVDGKNNQALKGFSNADLAMLAEQSRVQSRERGGGDVIVRKLDAVVNAIQEKPAYMGMDYDAREKMITDVYVTQNRILKRKRKSGSIFGG